MTRKVLTITLLTTLLFVNVVSANTFTNKAYTLANNTKKAATDLSIYVKAHPVVSTLVVASLMGTQRIKNVFSYAEENPYTTMAGLLIVAGTQVN